MLTMLITWSEQISLLVAATALAAMLIKHPKARLLLWQGLLLILLLLPAIEPWKTPRTQAATVSAGITVFESAPAAAAARWHWKQEDWLIVLGLGAAAKLLWIGLGFLRLRRYRRQARTLEAPVPFSSPAFSSRPAFSLRMVRWYASDSVPGPVTYGWRRPSILLPERVLDLPAKLREAIACHELIHVRRGDWLLVLGEALVRSLLWFHPAIWFVLSRIQLAREQVVDQEVIRVLQNREDYLDALVAVAGHRLFPDLAPAPLFLRKRHLAARVQAVIKEIDMSRSRIIAAMTAVCSTVLIAAFAAVWMFPFEGKAQTSPDSAGITVDAGAPLLHRAPVVAAAGAAGTVTVQATLNAKGEVTDARVVSGPEQLRKAAMTSIFEWHYKPGPPQALITIQFAAAPAATAATPPPPPPPPIRQLQTKQVSGAILQDAPLTVAAIEFSGVSSEAEQDIRSLLKVHEGDSITRQDVGAISAAVQAFDSHLGVAIFPTNASGDATLRILARPELAALPASQPVARTAGTTPADVYRPGDGVSSPVPIYKAQPQYTEEAKAAKWQGTVLLSVVIDQTGAPQNIKVVRPLGMGLDEKAIEAVSKWKFQPGMKDGNPVQVGAQIEISFRLD